ncbi:MAG: urease accessory protein UreD [Proteobacteria bacterium]|nr:urease accessory protein UreD [Pseudomonadota bacterium]
MSGALPAAPDPGHKRSTKSGAKEGRAAFTFARRPEGASYLARQHAEYPFHVTRAFHLDEDWPEMATLYLQSVSGGLFQGDRLRLSLSVEEGAACHVTTQAATKVHSMERGEARLAVAIEVGAQAHLEYLSDPLILFPRARVASTIALKVAEDATAILADSFLYHDPAGGALPAFDSYESEIAIRGRDGELLALDRFCIEHPEATHANPALAGGHIAQGAVYVASRSRPGGELAEGLRSALEGVAELDWGASTLPNDAGAWARLLAPEGDALRKGLDAAVAAARAMTAGKGYTTRRK